MTQPNASMMAVQLALEEESSSLGYQRYMDRLAKMIEKGPDRYADQGVGRATVRRYTPLLSEAIESQLQEIRESKLGHYAMAWEIIDLTGLTADALAVITLRSLVAGAEIRERTLTQAALNTAGEIVNEVNFIRLRQEDPDSYQIMQRHLPKKRIPTRHARRVTVHQTGRWESLEPTVALQVGTALIRLAAEVTGLFETRKISKQKNKTALIIAPTPAFAEWLREGHEAAALSQPFLLPTVVPPKPWTGSMGGGYWGTALKPLELVKTRNKQYLRSLDQYDLTEVLSAINAIQSVGWKINVPVLEVAKKLWDAQVAVGDLVNGDPQGIPEYPVEWEGKAHIWKQEDPMGYKQWAHSVAIAHVANQWLSSKLTAAHTKLKTAERMQEFEAFYFPHTMDFRGRIYPVVQALSPQGDDLGKALLCFAEGKPLGERGAWWLKVHIANCYGIDKVSFEDRVAWVDDRLDLLLASAIDPMQDHFWREASDPWQALAACFDLLGYSINGPDHVSHLSIPMDGSCNGLQNFSALLRDEVGGKATNLVPQDKPADIYTEVAKVVAKVVAEDARRGNQYAIIWDGHINRKLVKQPVMTLPYGATKKGMQHQIEDAMKKQWPNLFPTNETWGACTYLADVTYESIGQVVIAARAAMDWLREVAKLAASEQYPVRWTTPMGLPVVQDYRQTKGKKVDFHVRGQRHQMVLQIDEEKLSRAKQAAAISPNLIHSYDAAHLMRTALIAETNGITSMAFIHDSYGTHACDVDLLHVCLREAFIEQYNLPLLQRFADEIADQLPPEIAEQIPPLPESGSLDLGLIRESRYFFA